MNGKLGNRFILLNVNLVSIMLHFLIIMIVTIVVIISSIIVITSDKDRNKVLSIKLILVVSDIVIHAVVQLRVVT